MSATDSEQAAAAERLSHAGCVFAQEEAAAFARAAATPAEFATMVARRVAGEPHEQVVGFAEFCGLRIALRPGVFVPRVRSELLVTLACEVIRALDGAAVVVDLCCGSGALGAAVAGYLPGI